MQDLMMDFPLTLQHAFDRAVRFFPRKEVVTRTDTGIHYLIIPIFAPGSIRAAHPATIEVDVVVIAVEEGVGQVSFFPVACSAGI